ncbi:MAG TPA: hypothetical protein VFI59_06090 [Actinomycetota bacterium]|nr:hypothetical protein [Actinomycetota bacterium]
MWIRAVATATALGLVAGAIALAATGTTTAPRRPVRALGANADGAVGLAEGEGGARARPVSGKVAKPHRTASLAALPQHRPTRVPWVKKELRLEAGAEADAGEQRPALDSSSTLDEADGALQTERGAIQIPAPDLEVGGLGAAANPFKLVPPDPNGDVGGGFYLQMVNVAFAIYDADTGAKIEGPTFMSSLFDPATQKLCARHDDGDPIVVYDEYADVWLISQFALNFNTPRFAECIAVSDTSDPTGAWVAYQFDYPNQNVLNDYPKLGVWPAANNSAYFASFNQFRCSSNVCDFDWRGAGAIAYERDAMIAGLPAGQIYVNLYGTDPNLGGQLPSDADGALTPGANQPNVFMQFDANEWGYPHDQLELFEFTVDWATDTATFIGPTLLTTEPFNPWICGVGKTFCVPQKGTKTKVDALNDRLMFRLQYRHLGAGDARMVVTHTVRAATKRAGLRWYELMDDGSGWAIVNQGTYSPDDTKSRWMGSVAMDADGNIATGYSLSSGKIYPSIAIAGRTAGGPADTFDLAERKVFTGLGSVDGQFGRWGDYSDMTVAEDGCTFYYTQQYYKKTGQWKWATRIVRFQIDPSACVA